MFIFLGYRDPLRAGIDVETEKAEEEDATESFWRMSGDQFWNEYLKLEDYFSQDEHDDIRCGLERWASIHGKHSRFRSEIVTPSCARVEDEREKMTFLFLPSCANYRPWLPTWEGDFVWSEDRVGSHRFHLWKEESFCESFPISDSHFSTSLPRNLFSTPLSLSDWADAFVWMCHTTPVLVHTIPSKKDEVEGVGDIEKIVKGKGNEFRTLLSLKRSEVFELLRNKFDYVRYCLREEPAHIQERVFSPLTMEKFSGVEWYAPPLSTYTSSSPLSSHSSIISKFVKEIREWTEKAELENIVPLDLRTLLSIYCKHDPVAAAELSALVDVSVSLSDYSYTPLPDEEVRKLSEIFRKYVDGGELWREIREHTISFAELSDAHDFFEKDEDKFYDAYSRAAFAALAFARLLSAILTKFRAGSPSDDVFAEHDCLDVTRFLLWLGIGEHLEHLEYIGDNETLFLGGI